jgi:hypothetical protein
MVAEHHYVPVQAIPTDLLNLIPKGDVILYTSRAQIHKTGWGGDSKYGYLVLTDKGIAFRATKMKFWRAGAMSASKGALEDYVPYNLIYEFQNQLEVIEIKHTVLHKPAKRRSWRIKVERCKDKLESAESFAIRKRSFGDFAKQLYLQNIQFTMSGKPAYPSTSIRVTKASASASDARPTQFCGYCGAPRANPDSRYCDKCGEKIG